MGYQLAEEGMKPTKTMLSSTRNFPRPADISDIRGWFGLVEQVTYVFSKADVIIPFRDLLKSKKPFKWTQVLQLDSEEAKETIAQSVKDSIKTFDTQKVPCMTTDWVKTEDAFGLMQNKYAIHAYTHGPVTGSGPSVKPLKYDVAPYWLS